MSSARRAIWPKAWLFVDHGSPGTSSSPGTRKKECVILFSFLFFFFFFVTGYRLAPWSPRVTRSAFIVIARYD